MKEILLSKTRYQKWDKFLKENDIIDDFMQHKIYDDDSYPEISFRIINSIQNRPTCLNCNNNVSFRNGKYCDFCCVNCQSSYNTQKRLDTYEKNTGFSHPLKHPKHKENMIALYGVDHPMKLDKNKDKVKKTKEERYGESNYNNIEKTRITNKKKYGTECILSIQEKKEYGMIKKYGVRNIMHTGLIGPGYKWYKYTLPSGKIIKIQGYEGRYIPVLIRAFGEENIIFDRRKIPKIKYIFNGKEHYYFPDFYVPDRNLIIEVKSMWTLNADINKNKLKFESVTEHGYNFKLKVYG